MARGNVLQLTPVSIQRVIDYYNAGYIASEIFEKMPKHSPVRISEICDQTPDTGERRQKRIKRNGRNVGKMFWRKGRLDEEAIAALYSDPETGEMRRYNTPKTSGASA